MIGIVDAHHHLWDLGAVDYPWLRELGVRRFFGDPAPIQQDYLVSDFRSDHDRLTVAKSVHIQVGTAAGGEFRETRWLEAVARAENLPSAIVVFCDLSAPDHRTAFETHLRASNRVRGVRQIVSRRADEDARNRSPDLLLSPLFLDGLRTLSELDLSFDLQLTPPFMEQAARLLDKVPDLKIALCHAGSPWDQSPEGLRVWRAGLGALAANRNVSCKLSGLGMFNPRWTEETLKPLVDGVLDAFGDERVMWGSNFPVDKLYRGYRSLFEAMENLVPPAMRKAVFAGTAERFYRL